MLQWGRVLLTRMLCRRNPVEQSDRPSMGPRPFERGYRERRY